MLLKNRAGREQCFWDDAYDPAGREHEKYLWSESLAQVSHISKRLHSIVVKFQGRRVLSLGGGVDRLALFLAAAGNQVVSVDISSVAAQETMALAECLGIGDRLSTRVGRAEGLPVSETPYDAVICRRSLHHMDLPEVVRRAHASLLPGGIFIAEEPICLSGLLRWAHKVFPFHPAAPRTGDEREIDENDLVLISNLFSHVSIQYFDMLARESLAYFLIKGRMKWLLPTLGRIDDFLLNNGFSGLRRLSTYVIILAWK
jgi:SAM-dependent methyltransferase